MVVYLVWFCKPALVPALARVFGDRIGADARSRRHPIGFNDAVVGFTAINSKSEASWSDDRGAPSAVGISLKARPERKCAPMLFHVHRYFYIDRVVLAHRPTRAM